MPRAREFVPRTAEPSQAVPADASCRGAVTLAMHQRASAVAGLQTRILWVHLFALWPFFCWSSRCSLNLHNK